MKVRNLVPWSGHDFSYMADDVIDLDDDVAKARIDAGLCAPIEEKPAPAKSGKATAKAEAPADA